MSLATSIKDFADILNDIDAAKGLNGDIPNAIFVQQLLVYAFKTVGSAAIYILTFQWFRDVTYLPLFVPELNPSLSLVNNLFQDPNSHIVSLNVPPNPQGYGNGMDQVLSGLTNSLFFSLPVSLPHLISIRRLFSQGNVAAGASVLGTIVAHSILLIGVIFGLRSLIIPWFALEPFNYVLGILAVAIAVNSLAKQTGIKIVSLQERHALLRIALLNAVLTWCEEMNVFHSINSLTLNANNTYLDLYPTTSASHTLIVHTIYVASFIVGHLLFSALFYYLLLIAGEWVRSLAGYTYPKMARLVNKVMIVFIVAFALSSFPYYGVDYLLLNVCGLLPRDPAYANTVLSFKEIRTGFPHVFKELPPTTLGKKTPITLDLQPFDRGTYLAQSKPIKDNKQEKAPLPPDESPALSFEELNYQGEYAWIMRNDYTNEVSRTHPSGTKTALKRPKKSYTHLRERARKLQLEAANRSQKDKQIGGAPELREGIIPGESPQLLIRMDNLLSRPSLLNGEERMTDGSMSHRPAPIGEGLGVHRSQQPNLSPMAIKATQRDAQTGSQEKEESVDPIQEELEFEKKINSTYSKGFAAPYSREYDEMRSHLWPIRRAIKKRYFANPVYKALLETDIDTFLTRQPLTYKLAENQEYELYKKRQMLERYYNWLRHYEPFEKTIQLRYQIPNSRSFVDRVYHQQFKGTLKIARRLFKVTFDSEQNPQKDRVLAYDQLLYKDRGDGSLRERGGYNPSLHEELLSKKEKDGTKHSKMLGEGGGLDRIETTPLAKSNRQHKQELNEDYRLRTLSDPISFDSPFIEESSSSPIYVGWDSALRKLVITNRFVVKQGG